MNKEIANILKGRLAEGAGLPFVQDMAGLVQTVEYRETNSDGNPVTKRMPVSYDTNIVPGCIISPEIAMVPDSNKKGLLYFEDLGCSYVDRVSGGALKYQSRLVLVCWMNRARITGDHYDEITAPALMQVIKKLRPGKLGNEGIFSRFSVTVGRILPQDKAIFSRYTYDESITQYLRPPFEFFGMEVLTSFAVHPDCAAPIAEGTACY
jgi:hypothetical protein